MTTTTNHPPAASLPATAIARLLIIGIYSKNPISSTHGRLTLRPHADQREQQHHTSGRDASSQSVPRPERLLALTPR
jgi:hypothetical protein